jgi:hypothetical protein
VSLVSLLWLACTHPARAGSSRRARGARARSRAPPLSLRPAPAPPPAPRLALAPSRLERRSADPRAPDATAGADGRSCGAGLTPPLPLRTPSPTGAGTPSERKSQRPSVSRRRARSQAARPWVRRGYPRAGEAPRTERRRRCPRTSASLSPPSASLPRRRRRRRGSRSGLGLLPGSLPLRPLLCAVRDRRRQRAGARRAGG